MEVINKQFFYLGHQFEPVSRLTDIWRSKKDGDTSNWNWEEFYKRAGKVGVHEYDIFLIDSSFQVVLCQNIWVYFKTNNNN